MYCTASGTQPVRVVRFCATDIKEGRNDVLPVLPCGFRTELSLDANVTPLGLRSPTVLKELVRNRLTRVTQGLGTAGTVASGPASKMGAGIHLAYPGFLETTELIARQSACQRPHY